MTRERITAADVREWDSLGDVADAFAGRGFDVRSASSGDAGLVCERGDDRLRLVEAGPTESPLAYVPEPTDRAVALVASADFETFTFVAPGRGRIEQRHGLVTSRTCAFTKAQFETDAEAAAAILDRLDAIGSEDAITETLFDGRALVERFAEGIEALQSDLVESVAGIPADRGDARRRFVRVVLDRLLVLAFLQAKGLLDGDDRYLQDRPSRILDAGDDRYAEFYRPLFDALAGDDVDPAFGDLPTIGADPFGRAPVEREFPDARPGETAAETNARLDDALAFLSEWDWHVDDRRDVADPTALSPAILGRVYERTVTRKRLGAYYTPPAITDYVARRTIHPSLLDRLEAAVGERYQSIDDVFGFAGVRNDAVEPTGGSDATDGDDAGGRATPRVPSEDVVTAHVETLYHDVLAETHVLDPAVGSGAFLVAAQAALLDVAVQCLEYFRRLEREGNGDDLGPRTRSELAAIASAGGNVSLYATRAIVRDALYGVDVDPGAVDVCKRRLRLSVVAAVEDGSTDVDLSAIDGEAAGEPDVRQGNALIGATELPDEREEAVRSALDRRILETFHDAGVVDLTRADLDDHSPFHWPLEFPAVAAAGGFDVVVGNPPWDVVAPNREEYFARFDERFRTRSPAEKDAVQERLLDDPGIAVGWDAYREAIETRAAYFNGSSQYALQNPDVGDRAVGAENDLSMLFLERTFELAADGGHVAQVLPGTVFAGAAGADLRRHLLDETTLRRLVLAENKGTFPDVDDRYKFGICTFRNGGRTEHLETIYRQADLDGLRGIDESTVAVPREVLTDYSPEAGIFPLIESAAQVDVLRKLVAHPPLGDDVGGWTVTPYRELDRNQDRDRYVESEAAGDYPVYGGSNVYQYGYSPAVVADLDPPSLWSVAEDRDPDRSAKRRIREKALRSRDPDLGLKKAIYEAFDGTGSQRAFVDDLLERERGSPLSLDDVKLDCSEYRIVFRNITNSTNERTMICAVVPKGVVCHHALNTIRPYRFAIDRADLSAEPLHSVYERVFTDRELFAALGLLNSLPFDYLMRTKIEENLVMYKLTESQVPRLTAGDDWFEYVSERAARLNCYGEPFAELRERLGGIEPATEEAKRVELQAEIDAAACHAYGLTRREAAFVRDSFHRVSSPRIMTDAYFDLVGEKFDRLAAEGPLP